MAEIGEIIKSRRTELGYSVTGLAKRLGVTSQAVSNWETKPGREPSKELIPKLAEILGVRVTEFLGATEVRLSIEETQLLNAFRQLSPADKSAVLRMLAGLSQ
jgi:transcriptional regulator with XRE-family HTH domain